MTSRGRQPRDAEVGELGRGLAGARQENVRGLHVTVEDAVAVGVPEAAAHGEGDVDRARQRHPARRGQPIHLLLEVRSVDQLHLEPREVSSVEKAVHLDEQGRREALRGQDLLAGTRRRVSGSRPTNTLSAMSRSASRQKVRTIVA